jgi:hypothetical protein
MDRVLLEVRSHAWWRFGVDVAIAGTIGVAATAVLLAVASPEGGAPWAYGAAAIIAGQLAAVTRAAWLLRSGPLPRSFLRAYIDRPGTFVLGPLTPAGTPDLHPSSWVLAAMDLTPVVAARHDSGSPDAVFDVLQSSDGLVTAAIGRTSGTVSLVSALGDGRLLHTSSVRVVAGGDVVAVHAPDVGPIEVAAAHRHALVALAREGTRAVPTRPEVVIEAHHREHRAYAVLGPVAARTLDLTGNGRVLTCTMGAAPTSRTLSTAAVAVAPPAARRRTLTA